MDGQKKDSPAPRNGSNKDSAAPSHPEGLAACEKPSIMKRMMCGNSKLLKAMLAMKKRGFSAQISSRVVDNQLELLGKNWNLIEKDNYQVLADAVHKESEASKFKKTGVQMENEQVRPSKILRSRPQEILSSPALKPIEVSNESSDSDCEIISPPPTLLMNKGKQHVAFPQKVADKKRSSYRPEDVASTSAIHYSQNEYFVNKTSKPETPIIVIDPEPPANGNSSSEINDITNGKEKVMIPFVKGPNNESPPPFQYIPNNAVFKNARISLSTERMGERDCCSSCSGNCLESEITCPCSYETDGEYAYTTEGLVREDFIDEYVSMNTDSEKHCKYFCHVCPESEDKKPCEGHLIRKFIKECWSKCGCTMQCGNRIVQRGIDRKLQVFMASTEKGWGVRTLEELPKGAFVCEYVGEVVTNDELDERNKTRSKNNEKHFYPVILNADWATENYLTDIDALCLDATKYGNVARFINHRCGDSNLIEIPVEIDTPDHHYYHLAFFTTRKVAALEELTWDYGIDFTDDKHPVKAFRCNCGSIFCKDRIKKRKPKRRAKGRGIGI